MMTTNRILTTLWYCSVLLGAVVAQHQGRPPCTDFGIDAGTTVNSTHDACQSQCLPDGFVSNDYAAPAQRDPAIYLRHTNCICNAPNDFGCWTKIDAWDTTDGVLSCDEYNVTSIDTCIAFCAETLAPGTYEYTGRAGEGTCKCWGLTVCRGNTFDDDILAASGDHGGGTTTHFLRWISVIASTSLYWWFCG